METLVVVVAQQKKQYYSRTRSQGLERFNSGPSKNLREVNCRYSEGILHRSISFQQLYAPTSPSNLASPKSNVPFPSSKSTPKCSPISIAVKPVCDGRSVNNDFSNDSLLFSERWAGPTYSNSPPPSSLPMPKFLQQQPKRTLSLDLPYTVSYDSITLHPTSKSAPTSPTGRECSPHGNRDLFCSSDSATKALRQILNLDLDDK